MNRLGGMLLSPDDVAAKVREIATGGTEEV
jgi:hypothetical protein